MTQAHKHIDRQQLGRLVGDNPDLLARLAGAFLRQLPVWLADFELHSQAGDTERVAKLLHKMKGSCHAVSATAVALEFEKAEHTLAASLPWNGALLLKLLQEMKHEFTLILAGQTPRA
jgi:HPt (histidine-containing phosphotransfer) domain-containing protein